MRRGSLGLSGPPVGGSARPRRRRKARRLWCSGRPRCGALSDYPRQAGGVLQREAGRWADIRAARRRCRAGGEGVLPMHQSTFCWRAINAGGRVGAGCKAGRGEGDCILAPTRRCARRGPRVTVWPRPAAPPFATRAAPWIDRRDFAGRCGGGQYMYIGSRQDKR